MVVVSWMLVLAAGLVCSVSRDAAADEEVRGEDERLAAPSSSAVFPSSALSDRHHLSLFRTFGDDDTNDTTNSTDAPGADHHFPVTSSSSFYSSVVQVMDYNSDVVREGNNHHHQDDDDDLTTQRTAGNQHHSMYSLVPVLSSAMLLFDDDYDDDTTTTTSESLAKLEHGSTMTIVSSSAELIRPTTTSSAEQPAPTLRVALHNSVPLSSHFVPELDDEIDVLIIPSHSSKLLASSFSLPTSALVMLNELVPTNGSITGATSTLEDEPVQVTTSSQLPSTGVESSFGDLVDKSKSSATVDSTTITKSVTSVTRSLNETGEVKSSGISAAAGEVNKSVEDTSPIVETLFMVNETLPKEITSSSKTPPSTVEVTTVEARTDKPSNLSTPISGNTPDSDVTEANSGAVPNDVTTPQMPAVKMNLEATTEKPATGTTEKDTESTNAGSDKDTRRSDSETDKDLLTSNVGNANNPLPSNAAIDNDTLSSTATTDNDTSSKLASESASDDNVSKMSSSLTTDSTAGPLLPTPDDIRPQTTVTAFSNHDANKDKIVGEKQNGTRARSEDAVHFQSEYFPDDPHFDEDQSAFPENLYDWPTEDNAYHAKENNADYAEDLLQDEYDGGPLGRLSRVFDQYSRQSPSPPEVYPFPSTVFEDLSQTVKYDSNLVVATEPSLLPESSRREVRSAESASATPSVAPMHLLSSPIVSTSTEHQELQTTQPLPADQHLDPSPSLKTDAHPSLNIDPVTFVPDHDPHDDQASERGNVEPKKTNIDEIITGLKQILGNNVQVANSAALHPLAEEESAIDSTRINNRGPAHFPEDKDKDLQFSSVTFALHPNHPASPSDDQLDTESVPSIGNPVEISIQSSAATQFSSSAESSVSTHQSATSTESSADTQPPRTTQSSSTRIKTRPVPLATDLQTSLQEVHYSDSSLTAVSSLNLYSSHIGVNHSYPSSNVGTDRLSASVHDQALTEVVHEPPLETTSISTEFLPTGPITEWVPVFLHPQVLLPSPSSSSTSSILSASADTNQNVGSGSGGSGSDVSHPQGIDDQAAPSGQGQQLQQQGSQHQRPQQEGSQQGPITTQQLQEDVRRQPGIVLPVLDEPSNNRGGLVDRPVIGNNPNTPPVVVNHGNEPPPEPVFLDTEPDVFDITLTATGLMGSGPSVLPSEATGRPYVVPVDIDDVQGGNAPPIISTRGGSGDQSVFIDGRRTYFNLNPTNAGGVGGPTRVLGVGVNIDDGSSTRTPVRTPPRVVRPPSASVNKPNRARTTTPLIRIDTCIVGDESACDAEHHEVCRTEGGVSSCMCRPGFAHSQSKGTCTAVVSLHLYLRLDRLDKDRLQYDPAVFDNPSSPESVSLQREVVRALDSAFRSTSMRPVYAGITFNKFYALGGKLAVNVTLMLEETSQTKNQRVKQEVSRLLVASIQQNNQNVGASRLFVDPQFNPIPGVQDVNECADSELNDCSTNAKCENLFGSFRCTCAVGFTDKYASNPIRSGRLCSVCSPEYCSSRGECVLTDGKQECQCKGSYIGSRCEIDGEVLGVALGASLAALLIIVLTLVCLCMWSRRWKKDQQKTDMRSSSSACPTYNYNTNKNAQTLSHHVSLEDRIRWAHIADAMSNYYTTDPLNRGSSQLALPPPGPPSTQPPPPPTTAPPSSKYSHSQLSRSRTSLIDADDETLDDNGRFHVPRPKSRSSYNQSQNIYYDLDYGSRDNYAGPGHGGVGALNAYPLQNMRPYYS